MSMQQKWALVTGASGFLGARLVGQLAARGDHVKAFVRPSSSLARLEGSAWDRVRLVYGDVTVASSLYAALAGCDRVYHLAANFSFTERDATRVLRPALEGTGHVLEMAKARGVERLVVTGSAMTLGASPGPEPLTENESVSQSDPDPYLAAKLGAQQLVRESARSGLPVVLVLPTAIVGPGDARPTPTGAGVVEYVSRKARVPIPDGGLNLVDVDDVAQGHILAMERARVGETYILGGENVTFQEMFAMLSDLAALPPPSLRVPGWLLRLGVAMLEQVAQRTGGRLAVTRRMARDFVGRFAWVSSAKAERELGYTYRPARAALERSLRWYLEHGYFEPKLGDRMRMHLR